MSALFNLDIVIIFVPGNPTVAQLSLYFVSLQIQIKLSEIEN